MVGDGYQCTKCGAWQKPEGNIGGYAIDCDKISGPKLVCKSCFLKARKLIGQGVIFDRTRRITGYLVGSLERFNNAKRSEERDRVKHGTEAESGQPR